MLLLLCHPFSNSECIGKAWSQAPASFFVAVLIHACATSSTAPFYNFPKEDLAWGESHDFWRNDGSSEGRDSPMSLQHTSNPISNIGYWHSTIVLGRIWEAGSNEPESKARKADGASMTVSLILEFHDRLRSLLPAELSTAELSTVMLAFVMFLRREPWMVWNTVHFSGKKEKKTGKGA